MRYIGDLRPSWRNMKKNKTLGLLGIAAKAGKLTYGGNLVRAKIQSAQKPYLVLLSSDSSENTQKRIKNCCTYYSCKCRMINESSDELGRMTGREGSISCLGVNDEGLATAIEKAMDETSTKVGQNG